MHDFGKLAKEGVKSAGAWPVQFGTIEGIGKWNHGDMTAEDVKRLECNACPGPGGCGGMYTANTMATAIEVLGMSLPGSSSHPAESADKKEDIEAAGQIS
ncbi:dihydroxy-acid dehydratase [Streptococcus pneumoniae]|nr:dihydroxy-acid dehydratase [Streptococcus pneumoniae]